MAIERTECDKKFLLFAVRNERKRLSVHRSSERSALNYRGVGVESADHERA